MRNKIKRLSIDPVFGILTRAGLNERLRKEKRSFDVLFIDFNGIHFLNQIHGYDHVNTLIKNVFKTFEFRKSDLVARWFSGDEIVIIIFEGNINNMLERFRMHCHEKGLEFKFIIFKNKNIRSLMESIK